METPRKQQPSDTSTACSQRPPKRINQQAPPMQLDQVAPPLSPSKIRNVDFTVIGATCASTT